MLVPELEPYTSLPNTAPCPHCGTLVEGLPTGYPPAVEVASFVIQCPGCQEYWSELRSRRAAYQRPLST